MYLVQSSSVFGVLCVVAAATYTYAFLLRRSAPDRRQSLILLHAYICPHADEAKVAVSENSHVLREEDHEAKGDSGAKDWIPSGEYRIRIKLGQDSIGGPQGNHRKGKGGADNVLQP